MTLININIPFPGLAGRVESAAPSPQFLDMFLSSLLVARCGVLLITNDCDKKLNKYGK